MTLHGLWNTSDFVFLIKIFGEAPPIPLDGCHCNMALFCVSIEMCR